MTSVKPLHIRFTFAVCFLILMTAIGGVSVFTLWNNKRNTEPEAAEKQDVPVIRSFQKLYPFADGTDEKKETVSPCKKQDISDTIAYAKKIKYFAYATGEYTSAKNPLSVTFRNIAFKCDEIMQNDVVENGEYPFVRLPNGYFANVFPYSHSQESWDNILNFAKWLKERNIRFLTLLPANKSDDSITVFPDCVPHGFAKMSDEYKAFHEEHGLAFVDAKDILLSENADFYSWFYRTDHHWNVHAGITVAGAVAELLNGKFKIRADVNAVKKEKFEFSFYPKCFLGSMGIKMGPEYVEDMEVFYPKFDTCFHIQILSLGMDRTGSFHDTMIAQKYLSDEASYAVFLFGDHPLVRIENKNCNNGTRVLMIKKSNANFICPYLACTVQYLDMIDPRLFNGSIRTFIEQTHPDIVITCASVICEDEESLWRLK